jgi:hypothetical protein
MINSTSFTDAAIKAEKDRLVGTIVSANSANDHSPIYGKVVDVRLCISNYQSRNAWRILVDIENAGTVRVADHGTVVVQSNP